MKRTIDMMAAARAKGVELPGEWFKTVGYTERVQCGDWSHRSTSGYEVDVQKEKSIYIGPDFTLPENLHHAFRFADALCAPGFRAVIEWDGDVFRGEIIHRTRKVGPCVYADAKDAERHLAIVAACEAALGIERGEVGA